MSLGQGTPCLGLAKALNDARSKVTIRGAGTELALLKKHQAPGTAPSSSHTLPADTGCESFAEVQLVTTQCPCPPKIRVL